MAVTHGHEVGIYDRLEKIDALREIGIDFETIGLDPMGTNPLIDLSMRVAQKTIGFDLAPYPPDVDPEKVCEVGKKYMEKLQSMTIHNGSSTQA